jgi:hypothetical protein
MAEMFEGLDGRKAKDVEVLSDFISIFCRENHPSEVKDAVSVKDMRLRQVLAGRELMLCRDCSRLLKHGIAKLLLCPYDPKPMCKKCETHCYAPGYRERIRKVMKFSGLYLVKHGRLDLMVHYFS